MTEFPHDSDVDYWRAKYYALKERIAEYQSTSIVTDYMADRLEHSGDYAHFIHREAGRLIANELVEEPRAYIRRAYKLENSPGDELVVTSVFVVLDPEEV